MLKIWTMSRIYQSLGRLALIGGILLSGLCYGQTSPKIHLPTRAPASYIPDDDVIVKPIDNELSFYQQYVASDKSNEVAQSRNQLKIWNDNQTFADQYGMDSSLAGSAFFVPTPEEKFEYFKDRYMRYLRRRGEQPLKDAPKTWYQEYRASNEVDTIDEMENRFKSNNKTTHNSNLPESLQVKEVSMWKKTKFIFQPRVDQGLVVVGIRSPLAYARAWVGVNGQTEVNVQSNLDKVGFRAMFNYYAHSGKYFTSFDQRLMENIYARLTLTKDPATEVQDDTLMLLYAKQF
jgi:hypothetical protein